MLEIHDLTKRYADVVALDGASFSVAPGRIVGFLGPNGAGKTTSMRTIFGLVRPDRGDVRWRGRPRAPRSGPDSATCRRNGASTRG
jgi:ABC-2 type transport system ATP-binding protein